MVTRDLKWGIGTHTEQLANHLKCKGIQVDIKTGMGNLRTNQIPAKLKGYDIVHVQGSCFGASGTVPSIPMVTTVHTLLKTEWEYQKKLSFKLGRPFEDRTLRKSDRIIAVSEAIKNELNQDYKIPTTKIDVIPNAIDVSEFDSYLETDRNPVFVMSCGRNVKRKDFKTLKEACVNARIPLELFHGELTREELLQKYKEASVFVCSSLYESFGYFIAEAMASKCPVIASNIEGVKDLVIDEETGLVFETGDVDDLVSNLRYLLDNEDVRERYSRNAYKHVKENFNWDSVTEKTIQVYERTFCDLV